jgi:hypothetical protein
MIHLDSRFAVLFSLSMYKYKLHTHAPPSDVEPETPDYHCEYISHTTRSETAIKFNLLKETCDRYKLSLENTGRFFTISKPESDIRSLKGFIMPQTTEWCWFYGIQTSPKAVRFAQEQDADAYVKNFFSIDH